MKPTNYKPTLFACYVGYITQAIVVNLAPLFFVIFREDYGVSYSFIANLIFLTFLIQIVVDAIMVKLILKIGYRTSALLAHGAAFIGLMLLGILPNVMEPTTAILIAAFFYSIGGGLIEVIISPIVDSLPGEAKASSMSLLHAFYSWGQMAVVLLTTLILLVTGREHWNIIPILWALIPFCNLFAFMKVPLIPISEEESSHTALEFFKTPLFLAALLTMICSGASEQAMAQWASLFAEKGLGVSKTVGDILGPCLFAIFMSIGRTFYGIKGEKIDISRALLTCAVLTIGCYAVSVFCPIPVVALFGCAFCGFGVSLMWPGTLSYTSKKFNYKAGPVMMILLALGGDIGCSLGPWVTGKVSDLYLAAASVPDESAAIRAGLLVAAIFPILMVITLTVMKKMKDKNV